MHTKSGMWVKGLQMVEKHLLVNAEKTFCRANQILSSPFKGGQKSVLADREGKVGWEIDTGTHWALWVQYWGKEGQTNVRAWKQNKTKQNNQALRVWAVCVFLFWAS